MAKPLRLAGHPRKLWLVLVVVAAASGCGGDETETGPTTPFSAAGERQAVEVQLAREFKGEVPGAEVRCSEVNTRKLDCEVLNAKDEGVARYTAIVNTRTGDWRAQPTKSSQLEIHPK